MLRLRPSEALTTANANASLNIACERLDIPTRACKISSLPSGLTSDGEFGVYEVRTHLSRLLAYVREARACSSRGMVFLRPSWCPSSVAKARPVPFGSDRSSPVFFAGRTTELSALDMHLADTWCGQRCGIALIDSIQGTCKTQLRQEVAKRAQQSARPYCAWNRGLAR